MKKEVLEKLKKRAEEYVLSQSTHDVKVLKTEFSEKFTFLGQDSLVFLVTTNEKECNEWWTIIGFYPMNLYAKAIFKTADEAFSMHLGLSMRMAEDSMFEDVDSDSVN